MQDFNKLGAITLKWLCGADDPGKQLSVYGPVVLLNQDDGNYVGYTWMSASCNLLKRGA